MKNRIGEHHIYSMSRKEILDLFELYDCRDPAGHLLVHFADFLDLVERAAPSEARNRNNLEIVQSPDTSSRYVYIVDHE